MAGKILLIDKDSSAVESNASLLAQNGFEAFRAHTGQEGLRCAYQHQPDLVLLEPGVAAPDGWEVCRRLREMSDVLIIIFSSLDDPGDIVRGLDSGADDYIVKPCDDSVLLARLRARLRRAPASSPSNELVFREGALRINFLNREVTARGEPQHLTPKEFGLLSVLARSGGRVVTREELVTEAWGKEYGDAINNLKLYIHYLRKKIESDTQNPEFIVTMRGVGYRFVGN